MGLVAVLIGLWTGWMSIELEFSFECGQLPLFSSVQINCGTHTAQLPLFFPGEVGGCNYACVPCGQVL